MPIRVKRCSILTVNLMEIPWKRRSSLVSFNSSMNERKCRSTVRSIRTSFSHSFRSFFYGRNRNHHAVQPSSEANPTTSRRTKSSSTQNRNGHRYEHVFSDFDWLRIWLIDAFSRCISRPSEGRDPAFVRTRRTNDRWGDDDEHRFRCQSTTIECFFDPSQIRHVHCWTHEFVNGKKFRFAQWVLSSSITVVQSNEDWKKLHTNAVERQTIVQLTSPNQFDWLIKAAAGARPNEKPSD